MDILPSQSNSKVFLLIVSILYFIFCIDPNLGEYDINIFYNNLSQPNIASWLLSQIIFDTFIFVITREAFIRVKDNLAKCVFFAIMMDSLISLVISIIFGYNTSLILLSTRCAITIIGMFYAYFNLNK